jgi:hypothetical protein
MLCVRGHDDGVHGRREKEGAGPRASRGHSCSSRGEEDGRIFFFFFAWAQRHKPSAMQMNGMVLKNAHDPGRISPTRRRSDSAACIPTLH